MPPPLPRLLPPLLPQRAGKERPSVTHAWHAPDDKSGKRRKKKEREKKSPHTRLYTAAINSLQDPSVIFCSRLSPPSCKPPRILPAPSWSFRGFLPAFRRRFGWPSRSSIERRTGGLS